MRSESNDLIAGSSSQSAQLSAGSRKRKRAQLSITWHGDVPLNFQNSTKAVVLTAWRLKGEVGLSELSAIHTDRMDLISTRVDDKIVWRRSPSRSSEDIPMSTSVPPTPPSCPPTVSQPVLNPAEVSAVGTRAIGPLPSFPLSAMEDLAGHATPVTTAPRPVARTQPHRCTPLYVPERLLQDTLAEFLPRRKEVNWYQCDIASCRGWFHLVLKVCLWGICHKMNKMYPPFCNCVL